jgi:hypothetical protein
MTVPNGLQRDSGFDRRMDLDSFRGRRASRLAIAAVIPCEI